MSKIAIVFPGQGSQFTKMGADFANVSTEYQNVIDKLSKTDSKVLAAIDGEYDINQTRYAQLALFANQIGMYKHLTSLYDLKDCVYAGFSLGEFSAYVASEMINVDEGMDLVKERSKLMDSVQSTYVTRVVLGKTKEQLTNLVIQLNEQLDNPIIISNYNQEKQLLINFAEDDMSFITQQLTDNGVKRIIEIKVSGPFHTPIYNDAANQLASFASNIKCKNTNNIYTNVDGKLIADRDFSQLLIDHMTSGVQWKTQIETMIADGVDTFVEIGAKSVVSALIKKIDRNVNVIKIETIEDIDKVEELWIRK